VREIAANMFDQGKAPADIARDLGVDDQTVRDWRRKYRAGGRPALVSKKPPGRPALLTAAQRDRLAALLEQAPRECGFERYLWTTQLIADLVARASSASRTTTTTSACSWAGWGSRTRSRPAGRSSGTGRRSRAGGGTSGPAC